MMAPEIWKNIVREVSQIYVDTHITIHWLCCDSLGSVINGIVIG